MKRRNFLATGLASMVAGPALAGSENSASSSPRQFFELRQYHLRSGSNKGRVGRFLKDVGIPALNRIGIKPVGVFNAMFGPNKPTLYVLLAHPSLDSVFQASTWLMDDETFCKEGAEFLDAPLSDPGYIRYESSLMAAFSHMPQIEVPEAKQRIFELRIYESHSVKANKKKIEMFNEGGEIALFKKTGLTPVFFGETIIGQQLPNLTYMLVFEDMADRDARWQTFVNHPEWRQMSSNPAYKDTVSNITDIILRPTDYSQI